MGYDWVYLANHSALSLTCYHWSWNRMVIRRYVMRLHKKKVPLTPCWSWGGMWECLENSCIVHPQPVDDRLSCDKTVGQKIVQYHLPAVHYQVGWSAKAAWWEDGAVSLTSCVTTVPRSYVSRLIFCICPSFSSMTLSTFYDLLWLTHAYNFHMLTVFTCFPLTYFIWLPCTIKAPL